jgi:hypothetical protein
MILLALGIIGDYVARNYEEGKGRPLYVVTEAVNTAPPLSQIPGVAVLIGRAVSESKGGPQLARASNGRGPIL